MIIISKTSNVLLEKYGLLRLVNYAWYSTITSFTFQNVNKHVRNLFLTKSHNLYFNLFIERPTIEAVAELFSVCGEIVLVRILRPGNPIPADVKPFANKHPEMTDKVCALVEYERTEFAHKAVKDLNKEGEEGMKVLLN